MISSQFRKCVSVAASIRNVTMKAANTPRARTKHDALITYSDNKIRKLQRKLERNKDNKVLDLMREVLANRNFEIVESLGVIRLIKKTSYANITIEYYPHQERFIDDPANYKPSISDVYSVIIERNVTEDSATENADDMDDLTDSDESLFNPEDYDRIVVRYLHSPSIELVETYFARYLQ